MIFTEKAAQAITTGRKTQHRVPTGSRRWTPGKRISIQNEKGEDPICHVEITTIQRGSVLQPDRDIARAEGFDGVRGVLNLKRGWLERHDAQWCKKRKASDEGLTDELVAARFDRKPIHVDVITWKLCEAPDLYLARPTRGAGDYTRNHHRAIDDLPVIDQVTMERYAKKARELGEKQRTSFKQDLEAERARLAAASPRGIQRIERGRSLRNAA